MNLKQFHKVYFIGIGGIGMSALARYFLASGVKVAGYDKTKSKITIELIRLGAMIHFEDDLKNIPVAFKQMEHTLVVYTPAIPKSHAEFNFFKDHGFTVKKRSEVLGAITTNTTCLAVAGTHGKTTTTSILGHLLKVCGEPVTAFLGGISENYNSNLILQGTEVTVVEADEFDRSFLTLSPNLACITSMDADHLDIYGSAEVLTHSFIEFASQVKSSGQLLFRKGLPLEGLTYGIEVDADYNAQRVRIQNGTYHFDFKTPKTIINDLKFHLPGRHNLANAVAALAMADIHGCSHEQLKKALASYKGVKRRFTYHIKTDDLVFIDDYAHHPEEINAVYEALKEMYPQEQVLAVFQPHLFSRTRDFAKDFAQVLSKFDEVILLDIYPARESPIEHISSPWLLSQITNPSKRVLAKDELAAAIGKTSAKVVVTMGAGDIGEEVEQIKKQLQIES